MRFTQLKTVYEAKKIIKSHYDSIELSIVVLPILEATGYVLAKDVFSKIDVPEFDRSTKDGYAVFSEDTQAEIVGEVLMGLWPEFELKNHQCAIIPTGGALPRGAQAVVMIEETEREGQWVKWKRNIHSGENVIHRGEDIKAGEKILTKGTLINAKEVGVMAAMGIKQVEVYKRPGVMLVSTGSELVRDIDELDLGKVLDINSYTLKVLLIQSGLAVNEVVLVSDSYEMLKETIAKGMRQSDIVIVSGGSSVGEKDYTASIFNELGKPGVFLHGIKIKPGKPTIAALANGKILMGLPGHPVSAMIVYYEIVEPILKEILMIRGLKAQYVQAELAEDIYLSDHRETHVMVKIIDGKAYRVKGESGLINMIAQADGKVVIPLEIEKIQKGSMVSVRLF